MQQPGRAAPHNPSSLRDAALGNREVVVAQVSGPAYDAQVSALFIGDRIDLKRLDDFKPADSVELQDLRAVFAFRFGVVVFFGISPEDQKAWLDRIGPCIIEPSDPIETEVAQIRIVPGREEQITGDGVITLNNASSDRLLLIATVLARSVVLAADEVRIGEAFDMLDPLVSELRQNGRVGLPIKQVMQHIGDVMATQHRVVGRAQISERPDLLWDNPGLDRLYARLSAEYELIERFQVLDRKLELIGEAADMLLDVVQEKRAVRLELAIIVLILFEICMSILEHAGILT